MNLELELETLCHQKFQREHILLCRLWYLRGESANTDRMIFRLGRKEETCEPTIKREECLSVNTAISLSKFSNSHHILRMVVHTRIPQVEPLEIGHGGTFDMCREFESFAQSRELSEVIGNQREFICDRQILDLAGLGCVCVFAC